MRISDWSSDVCSSDLGDALVGDAVVAGEDGGIGTVDRRRIAALPGGQPHRQLLQSPERAGRLGELALAQKGVLRSLLVRLRQHLQQVADRKSTRLNSSH